MRNSSVLLTLFRFLLPPALIGTVYLYLYPLFQQCSFPPAQAAEAACYAGDASHAGSPSSPAPFRLLSLADPQLEGDTSLPEELRGGGWLKGVKDGFWEGVRKGGRERAFDGVRPALIGLLKDDAPRIFAGYRKKLDLWGNDLYLAHIYWLIHWWTDPTHVVVLGDLLGSQWIDDEEFESRSQRFWQRVFKGAHRVPREVTDVNGRVEILGADARWKDRLITVAGNHDIGYAGDIDTRRAERFEEEYGRLNWDVRFRMNDTIPPYGFYPPGLRSTELVQQPPELHVVVLNSMNLDLPSWDTILHQESVDFLSDTLHTRHRRPSENSATVLLTHIPLHKEEGVCVDAPFFSYFPASQGAGVKEQNHLSEDTSSHILNGIFESSAQNSIILNGHDHEGCDTYHYRSSTEPEVDAANGIDGQPAPWRADRYHQSAARSDAKRPDGLREITVRSMMGDYGGNIGLLSAWWDEKAFKWRFEYDSCMLGVQHIWWAVHVLDLIVLGLGLGGVTLAVVEAMKELREEGGITWQGTETKKRD
ncbi:hypothetical protein D0863_11669 [Hortaea werneckii]|uniref:Calcineurin-like phosphoesterase domain-containing protein n=1 Tax=Hortaea werneckii TaxID=91943 RepID=A0A3M7D7E1_HORWE|nr:hypothetical protein D0863_11669 [Hortaea werneckii]